jgi:hypothetical protein
LDVDREFDARAKQGREASALHSQCQRYLYWKNHPDKAAPYLGVRSGGRKWVAYIINKERSVSCSLGSYASQLEAAVAYDLMALELFGPTVMTNFDRANYKPMPSHFMPLIAQAFSSASRRDRKEGREVLRHLVRWQLRSVRQKANSKSGEKACA